MHILLTDSVLEDFSVTKLKHQNQQVIFRLLIMTNRQYAFAETPFKLDIKPQNIHLSSMHMNLLKPLHTKASKIFWIPL